MLFKHFLFCSLLLVTVVGNAQKSAEIEIITQEKIQGLITVITYSPDGRLIASGGAKENAIKVWDIYSGKIIGKLEGHEDETTALCFSGDGNTLMTSAKDNKVFFWDLNNWEVIDSMTMESPLTAIIADSENDKNFYSGSQKGKVEYWESTQYLQPKLLYNQSHHITVIDKYNNLFISGTSVGKITIYDLKTKSKLTEEKIHLRAIKGLNFYNEGKQLVSAGGGGKIHLWDINDLSDSKHFTASAIALTAYDANIEKNKFVTVSQGNNIKVWNLEGELLYEFRSRRGENKAGQPINAIKISPDGSTLASSGFQKSPTGRAKEDKNVIRIWDMKRGTLYKSLKGHVNPIFTFDFHPDKDQLVTLGDNNTLTFWDFNMAEKIGEIELQKPKRELAALRKPQNTSDKKKIGTTFEKGKKAKNIFDKVASGDLSGLGKPAKEQGKNIGIGAAKRAFKERSIVKFSEKGSYLITKLKKDEIRLYEFEGDFPVYKQPVFSYQFSINQLLTSPDEKYLAVLGAGDSAVSIVDLRTRNFMRKLSTPAPEGNLRFIYEANSLAFSPDGSLLAVCFNTGKTFVYNTATWQLVFENILPDNLGYVESPFVNFSEDGRYMIVKSMLGLKKYHTQSFDIFGSEKMKVDGFSAPLDKPLDYAVTIKDNHIYFENLFSGEVKKSIRVTPEQITHISVNPEGFIGITFKSGQYILLNPETGAEEVLLVADGDNYIFKTAENFYKVSKEGHELVTFRIGNQAFPFEQFDAIFNRPDLVLTKMGCTDEALIDLYERAYEKRIKKLGLKPATNITLTDIPKTKLLNETNIPAITDKSEIELSFEFSDKNSLGSYNIWINNVPVHGKKGKTISGTSQTFNESIPLVHGLNKIQISCRNKTGYESLIQTFYVENEGPKPERDLYLVTIGTSEYKDSRYNLTYPVKDAKDLTSLMQANPGGIYSEIHTKNLFDTNVNSTNIKEIKTFLNQSKSNDVVIVFVAGHGVLDANFDYYFGTYDIDFGNPSANGLAYEELEHTLDGIKANRKILIMDTCHSGEVDKEDVFFASNEEEEEEEDIAFRAVGDAVKEDESGATPTRLAGELFNDLRKGTGTTVISSAGGAEFAMESDEWKNGLFTYCLLNGLKNRTADLDGDGTIMLLELQSYVVDKVSALSHGRQVPNSRIQNIELDFPIW